MTSGAELETERVISPIKIQMDKNKPIEVWIHKETGQLWEHLPTSFMGYALASIDIDNTDFTGWHDWCDKGYFYFDDEEFYNPDNFENLGEL